MEHSYFFRCEEAVFAPAHVLFGKSGKGNTVEVHHFIADFLKNTAYDTVLTGVNLQTDVSAILFRELKCVRNDTFIIQHNTCANDSLVHLVQISIQRNGIDLLLMELRVRQFGSQVPIVGEEEDAGRVTVQTSHRIDTLSTGVTNDVDHRVTLLGIIRGGYRILRFIEEDIDLSLTTNRLVMETDIIGRKHFNTQVISGYTIDGDYACLNKIICLTTRANTSVCQVFIKTNRLRRIFVLLTIGLLFTGGIESVVTFTLQKAIVRSLIPWAAIHYLSRQTRKPPFISH